MLNQLRVLRAERDWSQADLAGRLGVSRQTIHSIESGKNDPRLSLAFAIAHLFGRLIEEVFDPAGAPRGASSSPLPRARGRGSG